ncbi:hypothetical protein ABH935_004243 [Catenulispora sp. GAS73]
MGHPPETVLTGGYALAMGVFHDYFRAPDPATAIAWAVGPGGDWREPAEVGLDDHGADWFEAKGLDVHVVVGQLVAFAEGVPFKVRRGAGPRLVWPDQEAWPYGEERPGEQSPWESGLLLQVMPEDWVTTLAAVTDDHVPMLAAQWMEIPEVTFVDFVEARSSVEQFRALARRAESHGHSVFSRTII